MIPFPSDEVTPPVTNTYFAEAINRTIFLVQDVFKQPCKNKNNQAAEERKSTFFKTANLHLN
jgi:hypothetical protein